MHVGETGLAECAVLNPTGPTQQQVEEHKDNIAAPPAKGGSMTPIALPTIRNHERKFRRQSSVSALGTQTLPEDHFGRHTDDKKDGIGLCAQ